MLDFRRLQYLYAVYRYRNFTRASEELFVSHPTISTAIKSLEDDLGVGSSSGLPRKSAKGAVSSLRPNLQDCQEAETRMADLSETKNQILHLGVSPTLGLKLQIFLHSPSPQKFPKATIYLDEGSCFRKTSGIWLNSPKSALRRVFRNRQPQKRPSSFFSAENSVAQCRAVLFFSHRNRSCCCVFRQKRCRKRFPIFQR